MHESPCSIECAKDSYGGVGICDSDGILQEF